MISDPNGYDTKEVNNEDPTPDDRGDPRRERQTLEDHLAPFVSARNANVGRRLSPAEFGYVATGELPDNGARKPLEERIWSKLERLPARVNDLFTDIACFNQRLGVADREPPDLWSNTDHTFSGMPRALADPPYVGPQHRDDDAFHLGFNLGSLVELLVGQRSDPERRTTAFHGFVVALFGESTDRHLKERLAIAKLVIDLWNHHLRRAQQQGFASVQWRGLMEQATTVPDEYIIQQVIRSAEIDPDPLLVDTLCTMLADHHGTQLRAAAEALVDDLVETIDLARYRAITETVTADVETLEGKPVYQGIDTRLFFEGLLEYWRTGEEPYSATRQTPSLDTLQASLGSHHRRGIGGLANRLSHDESGETWTRGDIINRTTKRMYLTPYGVSILLCLTDDAVEPRSIANLYLLSQAGAEPAEDRHELPLHRLDLAAIAEVAREHAPS